MIISHTRRSIHGAYVNVIPRTAVRVSGTVVEGRLRLAGGTRRVLRLATASSEVPGVSWTVGTRCSGGGIGWDCVESVVLGWARGCGLCVRSWVKGPDDRVGGCLAVVCRPRGVVGWVGRYRRDHSAAQG